LALYVYKFDEIAVVKKFGTDASGEFLRSANGGRDDLGEQLGIDLRHLAYGL
jgi:hypothetical protein